MDAATFRKYGHEVVDMIADYLAQQGGLASSEDEANEAGGDQSDAAAASSSSPTTRRRLPEASTLPTLSAMQPGQVAAMVGAAAPEQGEEFGEILDDVQRIIVPGLTHWQSRRFLAYYPARTSFESILGDMFSGAFNPIGFSWVCSPACTELETVVLDWLCRALGLPDHFLSTSSTPSSHNQQQQQQHGGGGVIQGTASEASLVTMLAARHRMLEAFGSEAITRLVCYASAQSHSSIEKAARIAGVRVRLLEPEREDMALHGATLAVAMREDLAAGLLPFFVVATLGTTSLCSFDAVSELAQARDDFECACAAQRAAAAAAAAAPTAAASCTPAAAAGAEMTTGKHTVWLHVDAAYAGAYLLCPELRHLFPGLDRVDSFNFNPHKAMRVGFDCSALWVRDRLALIRAFETDPAYLRTAGADKVINYRNWQIPLGRRFRSLKLWFVLRSFGLQKLRAELRVHCACAQSLAARIKSDQRLELIFPVYLGLVCLAHVDGSDASRALLAGLNAAGYFVSHSVVCDKFFVRVSIAHWTGEADVDAFWVTLTAVLAQLSSSPARAAAASQH
jgi:aromatic-L-amino-acid/L-tryptophan decarboxylase